VTDGQTDGRTAYEAMTIERCMILAKLLRSKKNGRTSMFRQLSTAAECPKSTYTGALLNAQKNNLCKIMAQVYVPIFDVSSDLVCSF